MNDSYNHHTNSYWEDIQVHCHAYLEKWQKRENVGDNTFPTLSGFWTY